MSISMIWANYTIIHLNHSNWSTRVKYSTAKIKLSRPKLRVGQLWLLSMLLRSSLKKYRLVYVDRTIIWTSCKRSWYEYWFGGIESIRYRWILNGKSSSIHECHITSSRPRQNVIDAKRSPIPRYAWGHDEWPRHFASFDEYRSYDAEHDKE